MLKSVLISLGAVNGDKSAIGKAESRAGILFGKEVANAAE